MREDSYFTTKTLAKYWHISARTLERWRSEGSGPRFTKFGHRVLYHIDEVTAYREANTHQHTSQYATGTPY